MIFETQLPHHNIKKFESIQVKNASACCCTARLLKPLNYRIEHRLILSTNN